MPEQDKAKARKKELKAAMRRVFATEDGKKVLNHLMRRFHILGGNFDDDPYRHAYFEGERNAILEIVDNVIETPEEYRRRYEEVKTESTLEWAED